MRPRTAPLPKATSPLRRLVANTVWMLAGKGFGAVCSLIYLAVLTRSLGLKGFGHFSLIFGTSQALVAIAGFQTWRVVVRYGAHHVHAKDWAAFGRLGVLAGLIDAFGAICGCALAWIATYGFGETLEINPTLVGTAFWFNVAALWALSSAPTGIVRALDRFDVAVYVEAIVPLGRLLTVVAISLTGPSLTAFLIGWAAIELLEAALYWAVAWWLCPQAFHRWRLGDLRRVWDENPGVGRFSLVTYFGASISAAVRSGPLLAIGYFVGTSAAGLYRLANQLAQGLSKLSTLLTRAAYAEISRTAVAEVSELRNLAVKTTKVAGIAGVVVMTLAVLAGGSLLELMGGAAFRRGYAILVPLTLAACFDLASVACEPVLHATGRANAALMTRLLGLGGVIVAAVVLGTDSAAAIGWSVAVGGAVTYLALGALTIRALRQLEQPGAGSVRVERDF